jgi:myosin heavy subunit
MEPSIELLLEKYGITSKDQRFQKPSKDLPRPQSSVKDHPRASTSPLQEKIKLLEHYNFEYETEIQRLKSEISDLKFKLNSSSLQNENTIKTLELESEVKLLTGKIKNFEDQNNFLKTQLEFYEAENKRTLDQYTIDKENWILQYENLKRQYQQKQIGENANTQSVKIDKEENKHLRDQVSKLRNTEKILSEEIRDLKKNIEKDREDYRSKMKLGEQEIKNLQDDYEISIQELKQENEKLKNICSFQNNSISECEKKIRELERIKKLSEEAREALKKQQQATEYFIKDVVSVNGQLVDTLKKDPRKSSISKDYEPSSSSSFKRLKSSSSSSGLKTAPEDKNARKRVSVPSYLNNEIKLQEQVSELENEIAEINTKYKTLLQTSENENSDYLKLKKDLDGMAKLIDEKNKNLFAAKRKLSSLLRQKMMNFEI